MGKMRKVWQQKNTRKTGEIKFKASWRKVKSEHFLYLSRRYCEVGAQKLA